MQPVTVPRRDPAPSRLGYRYQRLMLTPGFRRMVRIGVPLALIVVISTTWFSNPLNREMLQTGIADLRSSIEQRPEFMVAAMSIEGNGQDIAPEVMEDIRAVLPVSFPVSSFDLDLETMRASVEAIPAVAGATLRIRAGGILDIRVTPRIPAAVWRQSETLLLIDSTGKVMGAIASRGEHADLPLIAGDGAQDVIGEALALFAVAGPLSPRIRGLVRMGERRWDVVLDREQRLLLPTKNPISALERIVAMSQAQDLLERDVVVVDMRNADRPTIRLGENAVAQMRRINASVSGAGN
jgi:cell division protein FtsQ